MTPVEVLAWACIGFLLLRASQNIAHLLKNIAVIKQARQATTKVRLQRQYYLIIPVLREQAVIADTLRYLSRLKGGTDHYTLVVATTQREKADHRKHQARLKQLGRDVAAGMPASRLCDAYAGVFDRTTLERVSRLTNDASGTIAAKLQHVYDSYRLTDDIVTEVATELNERIRPDFVRIVEYPDAAGLMVHQINYAVQSLSAQPADYIAMYNADSRPPLDTLIKAEQTIQTQRDGQLPPVLQQSSLFMLGVAETARGYAWRANAFHQSLWTLKHELTMIRLQSKHAAQVTPGMSFWRRLWHTRFTVCTCHGLFVNAAYYRAMPFREDMIVEDVSYGLMQSLRHTPVVPLLALEDSESPTSLTSVIRQKRTWFRLVFDLAKLCREAGRATQSGGAARLEVAALRLQIAPIYIFWFLHSLVLLWPLLAGIIGLNLALVASWCAALSLYWLVPAWIMNANLPQLTGGLSLSAGRLLMVYAAGLPAIMSHSVGPWLAVYDQLRKRLGLHVEKKKTER